MRNLLSTVAALSIAAIPAIAAAQQQSADPVPPSSVGPSAVSNGQADQSTSASTDASTGNSASSTSATSSGSADITSGAGASVEAQGDASTQAIGAPPATYPLCRGNIQDECINPREAGKNFGNRPLKYWPGKPASE